MTAGRESVVMAQSHDICHEYDCGQQPNLPIHNHNTHRIHNTIDCINKSHNFYVK